MRAVDFAVSFLYGMLGKLLSFRDDDRGQKVRGR